ncbi:MAG: peptide deformylase [Candidatus Amesbacteria bacterium]|nr:peptide deformylase [Candidatus Amesbacteria bacterium]
MAQIITVPSEILRKPTHAVTTLDKRVINVINDMIVTLIKTKNPEGVGLAAPQIGENLSIFLARPDPKGEIFIFINPEITHYSQRTTRPTGKKGVYEGCLSIPGHYAPVKRSVSVTAKYQTTDPRSWILVNRTEVFTGFIAHVIQHETDHLNGILFIDRVLEQQAKLYKVEGKEWVEVGI